MFYLRNRKALTIGQKVRVYRNLYKGMFSIQDYKTKRVIAYGNHILLSDVHFQISRKGQEKVRRTCQKTVHAYVVGFFRWTT